MLSHTIKFKEDNVAQTNKTLKKLGKKLKHIYKYARIKQFYKIIQKCEEL